MRSVKNYSTIILLWLLIPAGVLAQSAKLKKAQKHFDAQEYVAAITIYHDILSKEDLPQAKFFLADSYRKIKDYQNAEAWYAQVVYLPESLPIHRFYYGLMLQRNGKCDQAMIWYQQYLKLKPYDYRKKQLLRACDYQNELMSKMTNSLEISLLSINSDRGELGPAFYKDGLVFASVRKRDSDSGRGEGEAFLDLYFADFQPTADQPFNFGETKRFSNKLNSKYHEAIVAFNKNETEIFFTRNRGKTKSKNKDLEDRLEIISAKDMGSGVWGDFFPMPFNSENYSVAHPALSPDGKRLFFTSDMPGGFGGKDLYVAFHENDRWSPPINLGPVVNTEGDELFPFYRSDGRLYFASDGHFGLGGIDIYFAEDLGNGDWKEAENAGYPINTAFDDFSIVFNEDASNGFFTSNRDGGIGGDDIYGFREKMPEPKLIEHKLVAEIEFQDAVTGDELLGVKVKTSCVDNFLTIGENGKTQLNLEGDDCCILNCSLPGYFLHRVEICSRQLMAGEKTIIPILLEKEIKETVVEKPSEPQLLLRGNIFDKSTGQPVEGAIVKLISEYCSLHKPVFTDKEGKYVFELEATCCYQLRVEKGNYFTFNLEAPLCSEEISSLPADYSKDIYLQPFTFTVKEITSDKKSNILPAPNNHVEGIPGIPFKISQPSGGDDNSISFLLNVYYDVGRTSVNGTSVDELKKLLKLLQDNSSIIVEISSHTDSNGTDKFNFNLSQRRADNIVRWLISSGISKKRLVAKGYGESRLVNGCSDGQPCSEAEHQLNRRTEFRVLGHLESGS